jgi:hypothetical protein
MSDISDLEKKGGSVEADLAAQVEQLGPKEAALAAASHFDPPTPQEEAQIIRKLDLRLLPLVFVLYSLAVLDRSNLGNARLAGLEEDVDLSGGKCESSEADVWMVKCSADGDLMSRRLARHAVLHLLHHLPMDADGLETLQTSHLVLRRRTLMGLYRHNTSSRSQLGRAHDMPLLFGYRRSSIRSG